MFQKELTSEFLAKKTGAFSSALQVGDFIYISGQLPTNKDGQMSDNITEQVQQALRNITHILKDNGLDLRHVVKTTIYLKRIEDMAIVNEQYAKFFNEPYPARVCLQVAGLPLNALVEIEAMVIDTRQLEQMSAYECAGGCDSCHSNCDSGCDGGCC